MLTAGLHFPPVCVGACVCMRVRAQCWSWPDGDLLCIEYSPGAGEGRGHPGRVPDSQEPQTAETPHGADTGEGLLMKPFKLHVALSLRLNPHYHSQGIVFTAVSESVGTADLSHLPPCINVGGFW